MEQLADKFSKMSTAERRSLPFSQVFAYADLMKMNGNREFQAENYEVSIENYLRGLDAVLHEMEPENSEESSNYIKLSQELGNNLAQAHFKLGLYERSLEFAEAAARLDGLNRLKVKGFYWSAKALYELGRYEECLDQISEADKLHGTFDLKIFQLKKLARSKVPMVIVMRDMGPCRYE